MFDLYAAVLINGANIVIDSVIFTDNDNIIEYNMRLCQ